MSLGHAQKFWKRKTDQRIHVWGFSLLEFRFICFTFRKVIKTGIKFKYYGARKTDFQYWWSHRVSVNVNFREKQNSNIEDDSRFNLDLKLLFWSDFSAWCRIVVIFGCCCPKTEFFGIGIFEDAIMVISHFGIVLSSLSKMDQFQ